MFRYRKTIAMVAIIPCALQLALPAQGLILCIGSGGHVAIETAEDPCCAHGLDPEGHESPVHGPPSHEPLESTLAGLEPESSPCGDCVDLPLGAPERNSADRRKGPGRPEGTPQPLAASTTGETPTSSASHAALERTVSLSKSPILIHLRTIVILA
jgi:hypothetical protein